MSDQEKMKIDPIRSKALVSALQSVSERVAKAAGGRNVRLVAVSKLKPASDILALYQEAKQEHFGENYAQELLEKASLLPGSVKWHFIGGLQSSMFLLSSYLPAMIPSSRAISHVLASHAWISAKDKCKPLASQIPNLFAVSSVDTTKKASQLDAGRALVSPAPSEPLNIHIQVNTSSEDSKSGVAPGAETTELCKHILTSCPNLKLLGLMTIGAIARSKATGEGEENEDFKCLKEERLRLERELGLEEGSLELSMGMSEDFEGAIEMGSSEVRVGSTIFGTRPPKGEAVV